MRRSHVIYHTNLNAHPSTRTNHSKFYNIRKSNLGSSPSVAKYHLYRGRVEEDSLYWTWFHFPNFSNDISFDFVEGLWQTRVRSAPQGYATFTVPHGNITYTIGENCGSVIIYVFVIWYIDAELRLLFIVWSLHNFKSLEKSFCVVETWKNNFRRRQLFCYRHFYKVCIQQNILILSTKSCFI